MPFVLFIVAIGDDEKVFFGGCKGSCAACEPHRCHRLYAQTRLELTPHHLIHNTDVALYDLHDLRTDILVHIVGDGDAVLTVTAKLDGGINGLEQ